MIDRPAPRRRRSDRERAQLRSFTMLALGLVLLLMPLFMNPVQRQAFDILLPAGWAFVALGALLQWRAPKITPASLARQQEADRSPSRRVRAAPEAGIGTLRESIGGRA